MSDEVCLAEFQKYLTEVKKSSANTLASSMRDVRQLEGYLSSHDLPGLAEAGEDDLLSYTLHSLAQVLLQFPAQRGGD